MAENIRNDLNKILVLSRRLLDAIHRTIENAERVCVQHDAACIEEIRLHDENAHLVGVLDRVIEDVSANIDENNDLNVQVRERCLLLQRRVQRDFGRADAIINDVKRRLGI